MWTAPRRSLVVALLALVVAAAPTATAQAQADDEPDEQAEHDPGQKIGENAIIGAGLGSGTHVNGLTGKVYIGQSAAIQAFIGDLTTLGRYDFGCTFGCGIGLSADYVYEFLDIIDSPGTGRLFLGAGGGGYLGALALEGFDSIALGVNGVFEIGWHFYDFPLEIVVDIRPLASFGDFVPDIFDFDGGLAVRYYF